MHNIFGDRFSGRETPAWHELGTVFTGDKSCEQAVVESGVDYKITTAPLYVKVGDVMYKVDDKQAIVRESTHDDPVHRTLGITGQNFVPIQNIDIARLLDRAIPEFKVETVGALGKGEEIFITLDAGMADFLGETIKHYFLVVDGKAGQRRLSMEIVPVRVVCQNTLLMAEKSALIRVDIRHGSKVHADLELTADLLGLMRKSQLDSTTTFSRMAETPISIEQATSVWDSAYPLPLIPGRLKILNSIQPDDMGKELTKKLLGSEAYKNADYAYSIGNERAAHYRKGASELYRKFNDEFSKVANTSWAAYNAVTELSTWREGKGAAESLLFGTRREEIIRAYATAKALVG